MAKYSDWRDDLREVMDDDTDKKKVTGKGCDNKKLIKINPKLGEAVEQIGGQILEVAEVDTVDGEEEDKAKKFEKEKQVRKLGYLLLQVKLMLLKCFGVYKMLNQILKMNLQFQLQKRLIQRLKM